MPEEEYDSVGQGMSLEGEAQRRTASILLVLVPGSNCLPGICQVLAVCAASWYGPLGFRSEARPLTVACQ
jgi:hypothetical protein